MDFNAIGSAIGFVACFTVLVLTIRHQKRFDFVDIGPFCAAYLAGTNVPPAIFLCMYAWFPDPPGLGTKLHGLERFVSFAGISLLLVISVSFIGLCRKATETPR